MTGTGQARGQIQFGVFYQGVNFGTIWSEPESASQHDFATFLRVIETAERGLFSAFFLGEGLRLREHLGRIHDLDIAGRPDAQTQLAALAAVSSRIGLVATQNTTYNDPADLAFRLASLDLISEGRAGWNVVTTDNAWTGENFRRGGYLDHADRYRRAADVVAGAQAIWGGFDGLAPAPTAESPSWAEGRDRRPVAFDGATARFTTSRVLPRSPQGRPVIFQAGDSDAGREFAAEHAEVIFSGHPELDDAVAFAADVRGRLSRFGRTRADVKFFPGQSFILADTDDEAREKADWVRHRQVTPQTALKFLEQIWGTDLSAYDPDGPLPDIEPVQEESDGTRGALFQGAKSREVAAQWRAIAEEKKLSIREFVIDRTASRGLVGGYDSVADRIVEYVDSEAVDGFILSPHLVPAGLDDIVNGLIPALQERGVYRTEYPGTTLRENVGLPPLDTTE